MCVYQKGLVSIIIPAYNSEKYICQAVESCLNQTYKDLEIIIVDDGSTDGTKKLLERYISNHAVHYIYQRNSERSAARNNGIRNAKGEFIQFLDADDILDSSKIMEQVNYLNTNTDIFGIYCDTVYFKEDMSNVLKYKTLVRTGNIAKDLIDVNFIPIHSMLTRREEVYFDLSLNTLEDWDYWLKLALMKKKFAYIDKKLCFVRIHDSNTTSNRMEMLKGELKVLHRHVIPREYLGEFKYSIFKRLFLLKSGETWHTLVQSIQLDKKVAVKALIYIIKELIKKIFNIDRSLY